VLAETFKTCREALLYITDDVTNCYRLVSPETVKVTGTVTGYGKVMAYRPVMVSQSNPFASVTSRLWCSHRVTVMVLHRTIMKVIHHESQYEQRLRGSMRLPTKRQPFTKLPTYGMANALQEAAGCPQTCRMSKPILITEMSNQVTRLCQKRFLHGATPITVGGVIME
jgi:hypothetical protein